MSRPRDELWDILDLLMGPCRTKTEASFRGKVVKELREAGATVAEVEIAHAWCVKSFDIFGEGALLKNFGRAQHESIKQTSPNVFSLVEKMANKNLGSQVPPDQEGA
jgi:hypothetical protein